MLELLPTPSDLPSRKIEIVDVALTYDDPYTSKTYLLVMRIALYIHQIDHNLITPFILQEAGFKVNGEANCMLTNPPSITIQFMTVKQSCEYIYS